MLSSEIINKIGPEHLHLQSSEKEEILKKVNNAGGIFLGNYSTEAFGDYVAGTNHVLPTSGAAKFSSGLGVIDFMKKSSIVQIDKTSFNKEADFSSISLDSAKIILNEGMDKFGSEYALGPSRVQFLNKDSKGWQLFNDQLIKHDPVGSANTLLGVQNKRPNLYSLEKEISGITCPCLLYTSDAANE